MNDEHNRHDPFAAPEPSSEDPRLTVDGMSLCLRRVAEELVAWLKTLTSAAV
jgi:hypothetical protein